MCSKCTHGLWMLLSFHSATRNTEASFQTRFPTAFWKTSGKWKSKCASLIEFYMNDWELNIGNFSYKRNTYARALFLDFSSAFNTIQADILVSTMAKMEVNPYLIYWYAAFLTSREQLVKVNKTLSSAITTNVGAPPRAAWVQLCSLLSTRWLSYQHTKSIHH